MLPRAATRAIRPSTLSPSPLHIRQSLPITSLRIRQASSSRRPPPPPPASSGRASRPPPPPKQPKQTSPGTSVGGGKDKTWKPQDGIKFGAQAMPSAANATNAVEDAAYKTPVDGTRPADGAAVRRDSPLEGAASPQEPLAQRLDADEPVPGSVRDATHSAQAAAENTPPPQDPSPQASEPEPAQAQQPLPDLRQGIPSTFDFEFGSKKEARTQQQQPSDQADDGVDITATPGTSEQREKKGDREEREYTRSAYETSLDRRRAQMANWLYASLLLALTTGSFYLARPFPAHEAPPTALAPEDATGWSPAKMYERARARLGHQLGYYTEPTFPQLLPEVPESQRQPFTLVLSLEDLMIHSTWDRKHGYRTAKRPGIDYFIRYLSQYYELVLFTSVPLAMADPVIKKLDPYHFIMWPLGREATKYEGGEYVKDLSYLNRPLGKTILVDTHAPHAKNQPENAIILSKWMGDPKDPHAGDLVSLIPFLEYLATMGTEDVRPVLKSFEGQDIAQEFARREGLAREKFNAQLEAERARKPKFSIGSLAGGLGMKAAPGGGAGGGSMVLADGSSVAEGLAQGKMMSDLVREQGQKQYEHLERQIRENGQQWLREEEEEAKRMMEGQMREMKRGALGWFGGGGGGGGKE
ncbi:hypothetical protein LTR36_005630 [Oleoguttula mirabilis]|uniref:Mitochondrial import inner membrane translocase subunit TIM50 n=1 Tax=Oleoguttula mirabilis TaxID=1507867 RepID=A0AAV9JE29_9PEZI|nr:hypothetical protein LTR36_005630 [Oleoguttula mirabilis]